MAMPGISRLHLGFVMSTLALGGASTTSHGATAAAGVGDGLKTAALGGSGTTSLYAYTIQNATSTSPQVGPNDAVTASLTSDGMPSTMPPAVKDTDFKIPVPSRAQGIFKYYGNPTVSLLDQNKSLIVKAGDSETITSASGAYSALAAQLAKADGTREIQAGTRLTDSVAGKAAAAAYDPVTIPGGSTYSYAPTVSASVQVDDLTTSAGTVSYALDSNTFTSGDLDTFPTGSPSMDPTLWYLGLSADGPVASVSDLGIDFELNPVALNEISFPTAYLTSLPGYSPSLTPAELAALIDTQIETALMQPGVISIAGDGTASLSDYQFFPDGTTFTPANGQDVEYADGSNAAIEDDVPEPESGGFFVLAALGLGISRRPRRVCVV